jgi:hypothetical protein
MSCASNDVRDMKHLHVGQVVTRRDIAVLFGGNARAFLPRVPGGDVVAGCFDPVINPRLPHEVLVHDSVNARLAARQLVEQCRVRMRRAAANSVSGNASCAGSIPIFVRLEPNVWRFEGLFRGVSYSENAQDVAARVYEISPRVYQKYVRAYGEMKGILSLEEVY